MFSGEGWLWLIDIVQKENCDFRIIHCRYCLSFYLSATSLLQPWSTVALNLRKVSGLLMLIVACVCSLPALMSWHHYFSCLSDGGHADANWCMCVFPASLDMTSLLQLSVRAGWQVLQFSMKLLAQPGVLYIIVHIYYWLTHPACTCHVGIDVKHRNWLNTESLVCEALSYKNGGSWYNQNSALQDKETRHNSWWDVFAWLVQQLR